MAGKQFEVLDWVETPFGALCLRRRELLGRPGTIVTEVTVDHEMLMSSLSTESEEALATRALALHGGDRLDVLVGGLGLGYTARAALATGRAARVEVVELVPEVIGWLKGGMVPLSAELAREPRLTLTQGDVYARLLAPGPASSADRWDAILVDVDHTPSERLAQDGALGASDRFYTPDGLRRVATHLRPGGVLAVWSAGDDDPRFAAALAEVFPETARERIVWIDERIDDGVEVEDVLFLARRS